MGTVAVVLLSTVIIGGAVIIISNNILSQTQAQIDEANNIVNNTQGFNSLASTLNNLI